MANLSVTIACNQSCSYCFARGLPVPAGTGQAPMTRTTYLGLLDFLRRSGIPQVRLLGGEPTLHPDFTWFVDTALAEGFRLLVFSNGQMSEEARRRLEDAPSDRASVLLNFTAAVANREAGSERQRLVLERLGPRIILGFTVGAAPLDLERLLTLIDRHGLARRVRVGLAHPELAASNTYLRPGAYARVGRQLAAFAGKAAQRDVAVEYDCGFVPCMFPEGSVPSFGGRQPPIGVRCEPVPDILPDGSFIACYPLATVCRLEDDAVPTAAEVRRRMTEMLQPYRALGIFRECGECAWRAAGQCAGGCLSLAMQRVRAGPGGASRVWERGV